MSSDATTDRYPNALAPEVERVVTRELAANDGHLVRKAHRFVRPGDDVTAKRLGRHFAGIEQGAIDAPFSVSVWGGRNNTRVWEVSRE